MCFIATLARYMISHCAVIHSIFGGTYIVNEVPMFGLISKMVHSHLWVSNNLPNSAGAKNRNWSNFHLQRIEWGFAFPLLRIGNLFGCQLRAIGMRHKKTYFSNYSRAY